MSWMDSWSRPRKDQAVPAPFYLTHGDSVKYCHTCGRTIGARRANAAASRSKGSGGAASPAATQVKFCSDKCKRHRPSSAPEALEKRIEAALVALLMGGRVVAPCRESSSSVQSTAIIANDGIDEGSSDGGRGDRETDASASSTVKAKHQPRKGDPRIVLQLSELETAVFGDRRDPEKVFGRRKNRARRGVPDGPEWRSVDMEDGRGGDGDGVVRKAIANHDEYDDEGDRDGSSYDGSSDSNSDDDTADEGRRKVAGVSLRLRRPPQAASDVNFSVGGERGWTERIDESPEMERRRLQGQRRAEEWEMVKQAARRAVVFGVPVVQGDVVGRAVMGGKARADGMKGVGGKKGGRKKGKRGGHSDDEEGDGGGEGDSSAVAIRKCEALMNGSVVEPSFAKGDWSIRWREE